MLELWFQSSVQYATRKNMTHGLGTYPRFKRLSTMNLGKLRHMAHNLLSIRSDYRHDFMGRFNPGIIGAATDIRPDSMRELTCFIFVCAFGNNLRSTHQC